MCGKKYWKLYTVLSYCGVIYLSYSTCCILRYLVCIVVSCLVCVVVVVLCVLLSSYVYSLYCVCIAVFLLQMPDCWLEVSIRKVLRPATSTQVFLGFPASISKCSDGYQYSKYMHLMQPSRLNLVVTNFILYIHVK